MRDAVPARWREVILVCGKCEKKLGGGFGPKGKARLSRLLGCEGGGRGRKADWGVVATKCLKLCPKGAVTVVRGSAPAVWLVVERGAPLAEVLARAGLDRPDGEASAADATS